MMISRWMSAKARRRLQALADGNIEGRVLQCFPGWRELLRRGGLSGGPAQDIDRGEIDLRGQAGAGARRRKGHEGASRLILGGTSRNVRSVASAQATYATVNTHSGAS
jgi:hypothetical protein